MNSYDTPHEIRQAFEEWVRKNTNWYIVTNANTGEYTKATDERFKCFLAGYRSGRAKN